MDDAGALDSQVAAEDSIIQVHHELALRDPLRRQVENLPSRCEGCAKAEAGEGVHRFAGALLPASDTCWLMRMLYRHPLDHPVSEALRRMREERTREGIRCREMGDRAVWS